MSNFKDETGNVYTRLIILARAPENNKYGNAQWFCHCRCGNFTTVTGHDLRTSSVRSCGCLQRECRVEGNKWCLPEGRAAFNALYRRYEKSAKLKGYSFELSREVFHELTKGNCYYCGSKPKQVFHKQRCNGSYIYNGIDRVDNTKGYILDNCVPCCWKCNEKKKADTKKDFLSWVQRVYENCIEESL